jgi:hypothetical protein
MLQGVGAMVEADRARTTAGGLAWIVRIVLVLATLALLRYGSQLLAETRIKSSANFTFYPWDIAAALAIMLLAGVLFAMATRFPFPRPRFAWGRLVIALLILVPAIHLTLLLSGWIVRPSWWFPSRLFRYWWFDDLGQTSAVLAGVAIGCGFGARRADHA